MADGTPTAQGGQGDDSFIYCRGPIPSIGALDTITDFGTGPDQINLSAFGLTATNLFQSKGPATGIQTTDSTSFFVISGTTYQIVSTQFGSNTYVYVDLNHNGNFETASDLAIELLGLPSLSSGSFALTAAPAGITGEPINLALTAPDNAPDGSLVTVSIANVPSGWSLSGGTLLPDGTWTVQTSDLRSLTITSAAGFTGAALLL